MEDISKKLEIDNAFVKIQAIHSLLLAIEKNKPKENAINGSTPKMEELDFLWELTDNECPVISNSASQGLVSLALRSDAEVGYILNGILNKLTSAKQMNGLISAVKDLLLAQASDVQSLPSYKNRLTQHPFVVVLRQNPQSWPFLLEQTKFMINVEDKRDEIFELLVPFFNYVLLDPNNPPALSVFRVSLHRLLVDNFQRYHEKTLLEFLFLNLRWLRMETPTELQESCEMLQNLSTIILRGDNNFENETQLNYLVLSLAAIISQMLTVDLDPSTALQTLHTLILKTNVTRNYLTDGVALLVGQMVEKCTCVHHNILTRIIESLLNQGWTSPVVGASFLLPLLHIVSFPPTFAALLDGKPSAQKQASSLIRQIEKDRSEQKTDTTQKTTTSDVQNNLINYSGLHSSVAHALQFSLVVHKLQHSSQVLLWWLDTIQPKLSTMNHDWHFLPHVFAGIAVHGFQDRQLVKKVVSVIVSLAQTDKKQANNLFPLLLHKIGTETDIDIRLHILHNLPDIATHKICIGPVLQTLSMLSSTPHLQSLALRLTTRLWQIQDRVFPFLHHLILEKNDDSDDYDGVVAKAASLKDICETRPQQFGADCLPALSYILAKNLNEAGVVPSVLALDGVIALCKEEVIDLRTTWKVLAPKLSKDHRPLVIRKLCELLSLAPSVEVDSTEFDSFKCDIVAWLWKQIVANKDPMAVGAAYRALGVFPTDLYKFKSLPEKAKDNLSMPANMAATPFEKAKKPEDVLTDIPGSCFTTLLDSVHPSVIMDYGQFLSSHIKNEVKELPRGVYHAALRTNRVTQGNKVLAAIPGLLTNKHEYNKIPGLQGSLAGGVLLSYEPEVEYGNNSQPLKRSFATQARSYQMKLEVLLNEVPIGAAEWQRSLALSQSWTTYMERAYFISVEGRKAELEMQQKHGTLKSPDDFEPLCNNAWLWARDAICDILRGSAKGKPAAQGNTILALGGLAAAVAKYTTTLDPESWNKDDTQGSEYLAHSTWMSVSTETIVNVISSGRPTKGRVFNWFQSSTADKSSLSMLVRACGAVSVSQLTPYLSNNDASKIHEIVEILQTTLKTSESPALQLYAGLGLGFLLMHLYQQRFAESGGPKASEFLGQTAKTLLQWALSDDMDNKVGSVIGLTTAACAMCLDTNVDTRLNAADIQSILLEKIESEDEASVIHEVLCLSVVCVTAAACTTNLLSMETAENVLLKLESLLKNTPNNCGIASALGLLVYWLQRMSYPNSTEMKDHLLKVWLPALASEQASTLTRLAAIHGLCSLFGVQSNLMLLPETFLQNDSTVGLNELLNITSQIISLSKDIGMQNCAAWMLGQLYAVCSREGSSRNALPSNYAYLNSTSILRAVVDYVGEFVKKGNFESGGVNSTLHTNLGTLAQPFQRPLPPLDWAALLSPIFQHVQHEEVQVTALQIAVNQSSSSPAAATLVTSMASENVFRNLPAALQIFLFESLPQLVKSIPASKLNQFVRGEIISALKSNKSKEISFAVVNGLKSASKLTELPKEISSILEHVAENIYKCVSYENQELFSVYCEIAETLSDKALDKLTMLESKDADEIIKAVALRTYLVKTGKQPLTWLNDVMEVAATSQCNKQQILTVIFNDLESVVVAHRDACVTWLLEIMGTTKNILSWKSPLSIQNVDHMCQVVNFFVELFSCAVVSWSCSVMSLPICLFSGQIKLIDLLPLAFSLLFKSESFSVILNKVVDWFIYLYEKEGVLTSGNAHVIKTVLISVRQTKELSKSVIWTRVLSL